MSILATVALATGIYFSTTTPNTGVVVETQHNDTVVIFFHTGSNRDGSKTNTFSLTSGELGTSNLVYAPRFDKCGDCTNLIDDTYMRRGFARVTESAQGDAVIEYYRGERDGTVETFQKMVW